MRFGPLPYEGYLSNICELFGCTPAEAEMQEPMIVQRIADYRAARRAVEVFNRGSKGLDELHKTPALGEMLVRLMEAQQGACATVDQIAGMMRARQPDEDGTSG